MSAIHVITLYFGSIMSAILHELYKLIKQIVAEIDRKLNETNQA